MVQPHQYLDSIPYPHLLLTTSFMVLPIMYLLINYRIKGCFAVSVLLMITLITSLLNHSKYSYEKDNWKADSTLSKFDKLIVVVAVGSVCILVSRHGCNYHVWFILFFIYDILIFATICYLWTRKQNKVAAWVHAIFHHMIPSLLLLVVLMGCFPLTSFEHTIV